MKKNIQEIFSRKQISEIAIAYSQGNYNRIDFKNQYGYDQHTFYTVLHLAVDKKIVSEKIAKEIQKVAVTNSSQKAKTNYSSKEYVTRIESRVFNSWQRRIESARNFSFSKKEAKSIVTRYSKTNLSFSRFCEVNCLDFDLLWKTIINAVIYNWVDDSVFDRIYEKALSEGNVVKVEHFFYQLTKRRKENASKAPR